ncbi:hypothetical protein [Lysobacter hankyongensis]|uniref:Transmembrane protein n=1 Tax=Lysobacter hankyongensis TaxID=1176535 RepID=A0ABP9C0E9_9GAMM
MHESPGTPPSTRASLSEPRGWFFGLMALEFAIFCAIGLIWLFFLAPGVHVWWLLIPLLPIHFSLRRLTERKVACPACRHSLMDHDGFAVFAKACDHCGTRFR